MIKNSLTTLLAAFALLAISAAPVSAKENGKDKKKGADAGEVAGDTAEKGKDKAEDAKEKGAKAKGKAKDKASKAQGDANKAEPGKTTTEREADKAAK